MYRLIRSWKTWLLGFAPLLAVMTIFCEASPAQFGGRGIPSARYGATFGPYYDAELLDALKSFQSECRGGIKTAESRWIDSICYYTMIGECYYRLGRFPEALENYNSAMTLYLRFSNWMTRVRFPATIRPAQITRGKRWVTWGSSTRKVVPGNFSNSYLMSQGKVDQYQTYKKGGVADPAMLFGVDAIEVIRCTTLAMRRRMELLGPVGPHDRLTGEILTAAARRLGLPNHWTECWIDVQLGLAQLAAGKEKQAKVTLEKSLAAAGQFDHPLSAVALFELGRLALRGGDYKRASYWFAETTYSAAFFGDIDLVEEGFRYATLVSFLSNQKGDFKPLAEGLRWARINKYRRLEVSLSLLLAETQTRLRHPKEADGFLKQAVGWLSRRDTQDVRLGAQWAYLTAISRFQTGNLAAGNDAFAEAMNLMRGGSLWLFHIGLVDGRYRDNSLTARASAELFARVLRDPRPDDWTLRPMEAMAVLTTPHPLPYEDWYQCVLKRNQTEVALEVGDRLRRHRFFSTLPFGGRVVSLRHILETDPRWLNESDRLTRQDLLTQYPQYEKLQKPAQALQQDLRRNPLNLQEGAPGTELKRRINDLANLSAEQELVLREIALARNPAGLVFPPLLTTEEVQRRLPEGHALLAFVQAAGKLDAYLLNRKQYTQWTIHSPEAVFKPLVALLREMGHYEANVELSADDLAKTKWKKAAEETLNAILLGSKADFATDFKQLIIVPDGFLWYVPFEALQIRSHGKAESMIERFEIRYAPTVGLAVDERRSRRLDGRTGAVLGRLFPRDNPSVAQNAFDTLTEVLPKTVAIQTPLAVPPSVFRTCFDRLLVFDDIAADRAHPYAWQLLPATRVRYGAALADWLELPIGAPQTLVLPGFHTAAENSLKQIRPSEAGEEMFLSLCGLMSGGTRTILISRWRAGGATSYTRIREFVQELPHTTPPAAWQRAVLVTQSAELDPDAEPRLKVSSRNAPLKADHPFFWAAEMLIDTGEPFSEEAASPKPEKK